MKNLQEVNRTVHDLVALVGGTRQALEEKLSWIAVALGGTDLTLERVNLILWHGLFILIAMLVCAFLSLNLYTRLIVSTLPPANLAIAFHSQGHFNPIELTGVLLALISSEYF